MAPQGPSRPDLTVNIRDRRFFYRGRPVGINHSSEFDVLLVLYQHRDELVTYQELVQSYEGPNAVAGPRAPPELKNKISAIRRALRDVRCPVKIIPVRGYGYRLVLDE